MSANNVVEAEALGEASLLSFELVFSKNDFFVSVNGDCLPSICDSFRLNEAGCFVLQQGRFEFVSQPLPAELVPIILATPNVLFVHFLPNDEMDINLLPHLDFVGEG